MSEIPAISIDIERERYKLIEEMNHFEKLKETLEMLNAQAANNPAIARQLEQFQQQHGDAFLRDMAAMTEQIKQAEMQYKSLLRMVGSHSTPFAANKQAAKVSAVPFDKKRVPRKHYI